MSEIIEFVTEKFEETDDLYAEVYYEIYPKEGYDFYDLMFYHGKLTKEVPYYRDGEKTKQKPFESCDVNFIIERGD